MPTTPDLIPTSEVAEIMGKSVRTVHRLIQSGDLKPALKIAGQSGAYLFNRSDVEALAAAPTEAASA